jgi:molybdopterin-guanine dinucleotide biosynthesis protein A
MSRPAGVILTGGASRRMGRDKAFVEVEGRPMVVAVADALWEGGCHPVECQGGDLDGLFELGLPAVADTTPLAGPVAAIADALGRHVGPVVVAACDLASLDAATVRRVIGVGATDGTVAVAASGGRRHLLSYWTPDALGRLGRDCSYRDALDVAPDAMRNVNEPDDL